VDIGTFGTVSFVDEGSPVCSVDPTTGVITPTGTPGMAAIGVSFLGVAYVNTSAFTVRSVNDAPVLKHLYTFQDAPGSSTVADSVGGANGAIVPPLGSDRPIVLDGDRANFPGNNTYSNCPYISLPSGLMGAMGDATIEMWVGTTSNVVWQRFMSCGNTTKGVDPHTYPGADTTALQVIASFGGTANYPQCQFRMNSSTLEAYPGNSSWVANAEHQLVLVWSPNAGVGAFYLDGVQITNAPPLSGYTWSTINDTVDWLGVSLDNNDPPLSGWFNELRIYEGTLTAAQVASDYAAGPARSPAWMNSTNITARVQGSTLTLSWPGNHQGWILQTNASSVADSNAWFPYAGSGSVTSLNFPIDTTKTNVFFRLVRP
jgi:hypothetical protein